MMTVPNPGDATQRGLWGGAVTCVVPTRMVDVSDIRQVPDNQEVFMDAEANQTIIFEIVEHDETVPDEECGRYVFEDLASENEAESCGLESLTTLGPANAPYVPVAAYMCLVRGRQLIRQGHEFKDTDLQLAVLRFPWVQSDLIISVCTPVAAPELCVQASTIMEEVLSSLRILLWELFGGGSH
ncbi:hypothetical protein VaNZ11_016694 [Volvox africanus]|uniref:Ran guanine nucleotide release factor n=1 Tax=Volvox africanus TaxID=51714 RepID=A0ABQ5SQ14_9CHLO|nr:hypothetical protein VaNZ11_016694 [Volvox africanus]